MEAKKSIFLKYFYQLKKLIGFFPVLAILISFSSCNNAKAQAKAEYDCRQLAQLASANFYEGNLDLAKTYAENAYKIKPFGERYGFLKARILLAQLNTSDKNSAENSQDKIKEILDLFEYSFNKVSQYMTSDDARVYMVFLAELGDTEKCQAILDYYMQNFPYFPGLGQFASAVYEKNSRYFESVLLAYLDYEYHSSLIQDEKEKTSADKAFLKNIEKLETESNGKPYTQEILNGCQCIKAILNGTDFPQIQTDFSVYKYLQNKSQLIAGNSKSDAIKE